jgi:hypothetical protein
MFRTLTAVLLTILVLWNLSRHLLCVYQTTHASSVSTTRNKICKWETIHYFYIRRSFQCTQVTYKVKFPFVFPLIFWIQCDIYAFFQPRRFGNFFHFRWQSRANLSLSQHVLPYGAPPFEGRGVGSGFWYSRFQSFLFTSCAFPVVSV